MRPLVDYLPLLIMPASGLIILVVGLVLHYRGMAADRKRHGPAE